MAAVAVTPTLSDRAGAETRRARAVWIYRARTDLFVSLCWIPLFVVGHRLSMAQGPHADASLRWAVTAALLISFGHQPFTLALVYGDRRQFQLRRRLFLWAPPVTVALVVVAVTLHLWMVVPIAAVWNTVHTLQQRYGLSRIYARRSGYGSARLDRWVLYAWMAAAVLLVAANPATLGLVRRVSLDQMNAGGIRLLADARPVALALLVPVALVAVGLLAAIVHQEVAALGGIRASAVGSSGARMGVISAPDHQITLVRAPLDAVTALGTAAPTPDAPAPPPANPAKWLYQLSSLLLIASIAVDPAAGFIAYVGAHAIEYGVVVYKTTESRYGREHDRSTLLGRTAWTAAGRIGVLGVVVAVALVLKYRTHGDVANVMLYTVGALHFLYDGCIWKLRRPAVAADFSIRPAA